MKHLVRVVCVLIVLVFTLPTIVCAEQTSTWSSAYFAEIQAYLSRVSTYTFEIVFDVTATVGMDTLGVSEIKLQRSSDNSNWMTVKTYEPDRYSQMLEENTGSCANYVSYTGMREYYYRAEVTFYAEKGNGIGEMTYTTESLYMP